MNPSVFEELDRAEIVFLSIVLSSPKVLSINLYS
jgi:hypothetical protein